MMSINISSQLLKEDTGSEGARMVCDDCTKNLSTLSAPDPWAAGGRDRSKAGDNKLLRKGVRSK